MQSALLFLLSSSLAWAQAPTHLPFLKSEAACVLRVSSQSTRTVRNTADGAPPAQITMDQEFHLAIPGRLEEWEESTGTVEFRFFPEASAPGREGTFKTRAVEVKPMVESRIQVDGSTIVGAGAWYLGAPSRGGNLTAFPWDVSAAGQVGASTHPTLVTGKTQSIQLVAVPNIEREFPVGKQPLLQFPKESSLWNLRRAKAPFSVTGTVSFEATSPGQDVKGTSRITFELTPKAMPGR